MNTSINFEIAKLLKEKGFDEATTIWRQHGDGISGDVEGRRDYYNRKGDVYTSLPTIAEVVMWLYEKHGIWISVTHQRHSEGKHWKYNIKQANGIETVLWEHKSPTEAYEAAIEHTLNNLI